MSGVRRAPTTPSAEPTQVGRTPRPEPAGTDDAALFERVRKGDRDAFSALVRRYNGALTRLARGYVSTAHSAEELAQETWLAALEGMDRFEGRSSFRTWLFAILVNRAKTRGVREGRSIPFSALGEDVLGDELLPAVPPSRFDGRGRWATPPAGWPEQSPEALASGAETRALLERAIDALPDRYRLVLTLRDVEGLTSEEVCNVLGVTETNQRVLLHRARARVRQALEEHFAGR